MTQQPQTAAKAHAADHYREAGVDLERGYEVVRRIGSSLASTQRPGALSSLGRFGGLFDLASLSYREPILVSGTDGVGTKLFLAFEMGQHDSIGIDAVAMCVNDVLVQGAEPLFFLDYLALPKAEPALVASIVEGVAAACRETDCALIGGETAEMNDLYAPGHYDIAGFCVGVVEKENLVTGDEVQPGDVLLGLPSSGFHSNGYSLLRKIYFKDHDYKVDSRLEGFDKTVGELLLTPTRLYVRPVLSWLKKARAEGFATHGMAHITGGGFYENIPRMASRPLGYAIDSRAWERPALFRKTAELGGLSEEEMFNVFNMGIGFVLALPEEAVAAAREHFRSQGLAAVLLGEVTDAFEGVRIS